MKASVLIVDHDPRIADATRRCLTARGCHVVSATTGLQCLEQLTKMEPSVVVLDPDILWGGADGVLECLAWDDDIHPMVVIANSPGSKAIPERYTDRIDLRIQRPDSLESLVRFANQLEATAVWSVSPNRASAVQDWFE